MSPGGLINIRNDIMGPILPEQERNIKNAFEHLLHRFVSNDLNHHCIQQKFNPSSNLSMSEQHTKVYHQRLPFYWIKSLHALKQSRVSYEQLVLHFCPFWSSFTNNLLIGEKVARNYQPEVFNHWEINYCKKW